VRNLRYRLDRGPVEVIVILVSPANVRMGQTFEEGQVRKSQRESRRTDSGDANDGTELSGLAVDLDVVVQVLERSHRASAFSSKTSEQVRKKSTFSNPATSLKAEQS
jgi:hypothetical protein